jgi:phosphohistidine phosphatase
MRRLLLLRHAKSSWDTPGLADLERPLAPRGRRTAPLVAQLMAKRRWVPDLVLCSQAERVRETWGLMAPLLGEKIPTKTLRTIYPGAPSRLLMTLRRAPDQAKTVLLIGHNPGLGALATSLDRLRCRSMVGRRRRRRPAGGVRSTERPGLKVAVRHDPMAGGLP